MIIVDLMENLRVALDGLTANKMRSGLTMLGVIIGVAAVIALMSVGEGAQASITQQINDVGSNLIFVAPGGNGSGSLTFADAQAIADRVRVPDASVIAPTFGQIAQVIFGNENINVSVTGVTPEYQDALSGVEPEKGRFIEERDVTGRGNVAVLGYQSAQDLFGGFDPVGQKIKVTMPGGGRASLTVVGVLAEQSSSGMSDPNDIVLVPITTAQTKIFDGRNALGEPLVSQINVVAVAEDRADAAASEIEALLRDRHNLDEDEEDNFRVMSQADLLDMTSEITGIMTTFLGAIAGISLLVGGIGIMNIMLVSVTERTREIGLRKAVGARKADILTQFLLEAVVLSLLGGLLGILLGMGLARLVDMTGVMESLVTLDSVALAVGFSLAIGLFFGIYPANQAAGLNPIEALRYE
ncbi:MAG: FtsX-like permease family protein [Chloroflexi bacterium]|nr:FtsX-like permease family protein [Chloroflexota bacterium]